MRWVMDVCPFRPCGFCMLNSSASASSSKALNFFPLLCFGLLLCVLRGAGLRAFPPLLLPPPARRLPLSFEKNCWVDDCAGTVTPDAEDARDEAAAFEGSPGGWLIVRSSRWSASRCKLADAGCQA